MKRNRKTVLSLSLGLVAAIAVGAATASQVYASDSHGEQAVQFRQGGFMGV